MAVGRLTLEDAEIAKILATMTEHLGRMTDPKYAQKLREDLLTLPADVAAQMKSAQETITKGEQIKSELKAQQDAANEQIAERERIVKVREATVAEIDQRKKDAEVAENKLRAAIEDQKKLEIRLNAISQQHDTTTAKHQETLAEIAANRKKMVEESAALEAKRKEIQTYEAEISETANQVQGLLAKKIRK